MKKTLFTLASVLFCAITFAQSVPQGINYQAVARDASGNEITNQSLTVRLSVVSGSSTGTISWQETHSVTTNNYGLFTAVIGQGTSTGAGSSATFDMVAWGSSSHYLKVEINSGSGYLNLGTNELLSVPYALQAEDAEPKIPTGTISQYFRGDKTWQSLSTNNVSEATNLYFTDARAKNAAVDNTITNGVTDKAPSQDAVHDALEEKVSAAKDLYNLFIEGNQTNFTGSYNYSLGIGSLNDLTSGSYNVSLGAYSQNKLTSGSSNVSVGYQALFENQTGLNNVAVGKFAGRSSTGYGNVFLGYSAGRYETGNNKLYIESSSSSLPLIYGDFSTNEVTINGGLEVTGSLNINQGNDRVVTTNNLGNLVTSSTITSTELSYLNGVTSNIQTQLNSINGVTSNIQTQLSSISSSPWSSNPSSTHIYYNSGDVVIGATKPTARLHVNGDANAGEAFRVQVAGSTKLSVSDQGGVAIGAYTSAQPANGLYVNGDVGIGTTNIANGYKLSVDGKVICEELKVQSSGSWPDYVFADEYDLISLKDLEEYITEHKHLPGIPPASEIEDGGFEIGKMSNKLMEKIEELTLYLIDANKRIEELEKQIDQIKQ